MYGVVSMITSESECREQLQPHLSDEMLDELEFTRDGNTVLVEHPQSNFSKTAYPKKELPDEDSVWMNVVSIVFNELV